MSEPTAEAVFVQIIHPDTGNIAEVPELALPHYYRGGWTLLTPDNAPPSEAEAPPPAPMTEAEAAKARSAKASKASKSTEG